MFFIKMIEALHNLDQVQMQPDVVLSGSEKRPLVLIAEDHEDTRLMLKTLMMKLNMNVLEAVNGSDAVDVAVRMRPDLILMDLSLPHLDGYEATRLIRSIGSLKEIPIVFLSGYSGRAHREKAFAAGGNDYLVKPLDIDSLSTVLTNLTALKGNV